MILEHGIFTVSLDFELYWGVRDKQSIIQYKQNLRGVRRAITEMLRVFSGNHIHVTWATVGFLFCKDLYDLNEYIPKVCPKYENEELSPYKYIEQRTELDPIYHFAPELIDLIQKYDGQEIASHTFSHYYCLEEGQSVDEFEEDISLAIKIAERRGISIKSLVFPRNQWNPEYISVLTRFGIQCYRGNESNWIYNASNDEDQGIFQRAVRLIDSHLNISGHNVYDLHRCVNGKPFNFQSSRFLRPYSGKLAILDGLRLNRIKRSMSYAAKNKKIFHLWWHPHNFGINTNKNVNFLLDIIKHYIFLKKRYDMKSLNMCELSELCNGK
jgi:peptidoglycan/xylan/chitin deacetylase (PgdA/CDA1 family)